jgi:protein-S-isoprenylcysteine O-methyltransferase Ste14
LRLFIKALFTVIFAITITVVVSLFIVIISNNHLLTFNSVLSGVMLTVGTLLIILGLGLIIYTNKSFLTIGKGTLVPLDPPKNLIVAGVYRYVRNPMIIGALTLIFGEALIFASIGLFVLFLMIFTVNHIYFVYSEEPGLTKRFGKDYIEYKNNVPRWIPHVTQWEKDKNTE